MDLQAKDLRHFLIESLRDLKAQRIFHEDLMTLGAQMMIKYGFRFFVQLWTGTSERPQHDIGNY